MVFTNCNRSNNIGIYTKKINCDDCLVTKEETAINIALPILYETYGEEMIKSEKPYIVEIEDDTIWNIKGSFLKLGFGGVFNIRLSAKDGKVIEIIHGK
jgi:hypothetical protein